MSIEKNRLRLLPHDLVQTSEGNLLLVRKDGGEATLPLEFRLFYQWIQEGRSISQIAKGLRTSGQSKRFASLSRFLCFLSDHGLLADRGAVRVAESMRTDYRWPESIAFEALLEGEIFRSSRGAVRAGSAGLVGALTWLVGAFSIFVFISSVWRAAGEHSEFGDWTSFTWLGVFVAVFCCGRSFRAICLALVLRFCAGAEISFRLRVDPVSIGLSTEDLSGVKGGVAALIGRWGAAMALAVPCALVQLVPLGKTKLLS